MITLPPVDIEHVLAGTAELWEDFRGQTLFITGGTGFFGCWLVETFVVANRRFELNANAIVLSRDPERFAQKNPRLCGCPEINWVKGSVMDLSADGMAHQLGRTKLERISAMIHLVTEANLDVTAQAPLASYTLMADGTRKALEFAVAVGAKRFLFTSSGAVYGRQPVNLPVVAEDYLGSPDYLNPASAYGGAGEAKRYAELLCAAYARERGLAAVIARGFAFVGPYLPLNAKFAIGNFIEDALNNRPIVIKGDGTPLRSYLYAADLAIWLWVLLSRGEAGRAYNVGSERPVSIRETAETVQTSLGTTAGLTVLQTAPAGKPPERYIPSTQRARTELGLTEKIPLADAIRRTAEWEIKRRRSAP